MGLDPRRFGVALLAGALGAAAAVVVDRTAPPPSADVARGSEEAFARGLHAREIPPGRPPHRWTTDRVVFSFRDLPARPARLEVRVRSQRGQVMVSADGVVLGRLAPGVTAADYDLPDTGRRSRTVELRVDTFQAGDGRRLGALLDRVTLRPAGRGTPPPRLLWLWTLVAGLGAAAAAIGGLRGAGALGAGALLAGATALLLFPHGLVRSPYAASLALFAIAGAGAAAIFARVCEWRRAGSGAPAFLALLSAVLVQGLAATWPAMVVSDALFHAHKLEGVAGGGFFPTSLTQHAPPFEFPYGASFYLVLAPLLRAGVDGVSLVRWGAAISGVAGSGALFVLASPLGAARAALAVVLLQLLPGTFDAYSYGNLSNVFGQALTVLLFAWWTGRARGGWPVGAALAAAGGLAHLSSAIVLAALLAALAWMRRAALAQERTRLRAAGAGLAAIAAYYACFTPLILQQLPRFLEGGRQAPASATTPTPLVPLLAMLAQWGIPVLVLAALGWPRPSADGLSRDLAGFWLAGAALALVGVVSPLEVRYIYALSIPLVVAGAGGLMALFRHGLWGQALGGALLAVQAALALHRWVEALLSRYS